MAVLRLSGALLPLLLLLLITAVTTTPIGGDGEAEELIAIADEGSAAVTGEQHFVGVQLKPNPHKRSAYKVLESPGLHSHFHGARSIEDAPFYLDDNTAIDGPEHQENKVDDFSIFNVRSKRDANEKIEKEAAKEEEKNEVLPTAAAQTMEAGYYRKARSRLSEDSMAQASGPDAGLRRVPRVNFVTQPRSLADELPEHRDLKASNANMDPMYRRPYDSYMPPHYARDMGRGRFFDMYGPPTAAYDRYDPMMRDYGQQQQRYDPYYYPRYQQMYNQNGYYRDRYDYPMENRNQYPGAYGNEPMNYPMTPNRRVIYYAHLPEVVRNNQYGTGGGSGYYQTMRGYGAGGGADGYDDPYYNYQRPSYMDDYNYRYYRDMNHYGLPPPPIAQPPPSVIYANRDRDNNRVPERDSNKETNKSKDTDSKTQTVSSNIRIQESSNKGYRNYDSPNHQAPSSDFTQPHYRME